MGSMSDIGLRACKANKRRTSHSHMLGVHRQDGRTPVTGKPKPGAHVL